MGQKWEGLTGTLHSFFKRALKIIELEMVYPLEKGRTEHWKASQELWE